MQTFDTANVYSSGESEVILGKFIKQHQIPRESLVILTKTFGPDGKIEDKGPAGDVNYKGLSRKVCTLLPLESHPLILFKRIFASVKKLTRAHGTRLHRRPTMSPFRQRHPHRRDNASAS